MRRQDFKQFRGRLRGLQQTNLVVGVGDCDIVAAENSDIVVVVAVLSAFYVLIILLRIFWLML